MAAEACTSWGAELLLFMALADASLVAERYLLPLRKMTHAVVWVAFFVFTRYRGLHIV